MFLDTVLGSCDPVNIQADPYFSKFSLVPAGTFQSNTLNQVTTTSFHILLIHYSPSPNCMTLHSLPWFLSNQLKIGNNIICHSQSSERSIVKEFLHQNSVCLYSLYQSWTVHLLPQWHCVMDSHSCEGYIHFVKVTN